MKNKELSDLVREEGIDKYAILETNGEIYSQFEINLSAILQCGHSTTRYDIKEMWQCGFDYDDDIVEGYNGTILELE